MDKFSISQISQFTGIKPNTLRAWENRYNAVEPNRSEGNTRYYDNSQLRRLLNIVSIKESHKISELCSYSDEKLFELVLKRQQEKNEDETDNYFVSQLISAGINYDEAYFEKIFSHCLLRYDIKSAYMMVIHPMLKRLGLLWTSNRIPPACEHFISNLVRQKLFTAIDALPPSPPEGDTWVLFLPENEFHDIGLLFANHLIRLSGQKVIFLGANVPMESLKSAVADIQPEHLFFFLIHNDLPENTQEYLDQLRTSFPNINLLLSGNSHLIDQLELRDVQWVKWIEDLEKLL
ncbi:MerR family transcriptional regulator [Fodinibius salsisoli]|uniref:MerR family transcriptional regulator n=1 Tax=Fodinibius salsisoli TaxID=2820877 RepID=A0ABT3PHT2_9BACT|nr:MerR family transcriptional regulator [Fodinibius salsisoli]MCW9705481.1 MerR family transcriptional regulator [Fodinibius salsisoli]